MLVAEPTSVVQTQALTGVGCPDGKDPSNRKLTFLAHLSIDQGEILGLPFVRHPSSVWANILGVMWLWNNR
jgi:hypothetical protein